VADLRDPNVLTKAFVAATQEAGFSHNNDFNGAKQEGFGQYQVNQRRGKRESTATAYLKPIMNKRSNLRIETEALATKLMFDGTRCTGVTYEQNGRSHTATANKEVIVSGGAINSPQLLMLSGIGDSTHLQEMGIPVVADLPGVGQNLIDHLLIILAYRCKQPVTLAGAESIGNIAKFLLLGKGMLSSNIGEAGGFTQILDNSIAPDLQFHFAPAYFLEHGFKTPPGEHGFSIGPTLVGTRSIGHLKLKSADPHAHPLIQPNYLSNDEDMEILVEGFKIARKIAHSPAFAPYLDGEHTPGEQVQSDDDIRAFIRREVETLYHPVGTCKMGQDPMAVVNSRLQVHGITGLRVADASIMPTIVNANTNVPAIMIGEKAADMILQANKN
jgi:choline dehydrogenase